MMKENNFGNYLKKMFVEVFTPMYYKQHGEAPDERDFAEYLGISDQVYSHYKLGKRRPTISFVDTMAEKLGKDGAGAYDAAGYKRPMPDNPLFNLLAAVSPRLTKADEQEIMDLIERKIKEKEEKQSRRNSNNAFAG
jgi:transcriptional regulator with XRE-family HTH domain